MAMRARGDLMSVRVCDARDEVSRTSKPFSGAGWARGVRLADFVRRLFLVSAVLSLVVTVFSASKVSSGEMSVAVPASWLGSAAEMVVWGFVASQVYWLMRDAAEKETPFGPEAEKCLENISALLLALAVLKVLIPSIAVLASGQVPSFALSLISAGSTEATDVILISPRFVSRSRSDPRAFEGVWIWCGVARR